MLAYLIILFSFTFFFLTCGLAHVSFVLLLPFVPTYIIKGQWRIHASSLFLFPVFTQRAMINYLSLDFVNITRCHAERRKKGLCNVDLLKLTVSVNWPFQRPSNQKRLWWIIATQLLSHQRRISYLQARKTRIKAGKLSAINQISLTKCFLQYWT